MAGSHDSPIIYCVESILYDVGVDFSHFQIRLYQQIQNQFQTAIQYIMSQSQ
jgi:hypothetical protein